MGAAVIPVAPEAPSENALKDRGEARAFFQPRPDVLVTVSGFSVTNPTTPSTEAWSVEDATDLTRMMLSEIEAVAGHKQPISEYVSERARSQRKRSKRRGKVRLPGRGDGKRASRA